MSGGHRSSRLLTEGVVTAVGLAVAVWVVRADDPWFELHCLRAYCAGYPNALVYAHVARGLGAALALVLFLVVRPRLGRRLARHSPGALGAWALRIGVAVALAFVVTDAFFRFTRERRLRERAAARAQSPGWQHRPLEEMDLSVGGRKVHVALDEDGARAAVPGGARDHAAPTILVLGESVAFGYGLEYDESIPARLEARTGVQTVNLAMISAGSAASLARLGAPGSSFARPVAVVTFVLYDWLFRDVSPGAPRLVPGPGGGYVLATEAPGLFDSSPILIALREIAYRDDGVVERTRPILREIAVRAAARGAYPLFVFTQTGGCPLVGDELPSVARRIAEDQPFTFVHVRRTSHIQDDLHPDAAGAEVYAATIEGALRRAGIAAP